MGDAHDQQNTWHEVANGAIVGQDGQEIIIE
jgi:hypothetical protein